MVVPQMKLVVIIPANNEEAYIEACLEALAAQTGPVSAHVIVSANACRDRTVARVEAQVARFAALGHRLVCLDSDIPGKMEALTRAEAAIPLAFRRAPRAYLDADVLCDPELLTAGRPGARHRCAALCHRHDPRAPLRQCLHPGLCEGLGAAALRAGRGGGGGVLRGQCRRARALEGIPGDHLRRYLRAAEFHAGRTDRGAGQSYHWPMVEGYRALVRVRRRQDAGVREIYRHFPHLQANEAKTPGHPRRGSADLPADAAGLPALHAGACLGARRRPVAGVEPRAIDSARSPLHSRLDQPHALELQEHLMRAVVDFHAFRLKAQFGVCGHVIGV